MSLFTYMYLIMLMVILIESKTTFFMISQTAIQTQHVVQADFRSDLLGSYVLILASHLFVALKNAIHQIITIAVLSNLPDHNPAIAIRINILGFLA